MSRIHGVCATHEGRRRIVNEDACAFHADGDSAVAVVADGTGGGLAGRGAAELTTSTCTSVFIRRLHDYAEAWWQAEHDGDVMAWTALAPSERDAIEAHVHEVLTSRVPRTPGDLAILEQEGDVLAAIARRGLVEAHRAVWTRGSSDPASRGMCATAATAVFAPGVAGLAHAGDVRIYRARNGVLEQLTRDHTLLEHFIEVQRPTAEEIAAFPHKSVILRAVGATEAVVDIDIRAIETRPHDLLLLCSDWIWGSLPPEQLLDMLATHRAGAATVLVDEAVELDGTGDNVSAVVVEIS